MSENKIYKKLFAFRKKHILLDFDKEVDYTTKKNEHINYKYASLAEIEKKIKRPLARVGLAYTWEIKDGAVQAVLFDEEGNRLGSGFIKFQFDGIVDPKVIGANLTYFKRYTLVALLGLVADEDDERVFMEKSNKNLYTIIEKQIKELVEKGDKKELKKKKEYLEKELEKGVDRNLGLSDEQIKSLLALIK